jgi:hypothetical protein
MSLTVGPALNRNPDNMAAPVIEPSQSTEPTPSSSASTSPAPSASEQEPEATAVPSPSSTPAKSQKPESRESVILNDDKALEKIFEANRSSTNLFQRGESFTVFADEGITVMFGFDRTTNDNKFSDLDFTFELEGSYFYSNPTETSEVSFVDSDGLEHFVVFANLASLYNLDGQYWTDSPLAKATVRIELVKDPVSGEAVAVYLSVLPKN